MMEGLEWLTGTVAFGILLCLLIAYIAYKAKSPAMMLVSSFGWVILAFQVYLDSGSYILLGLMLMVAFSQFWLTWRK